MPVKKGCVADKMTFIIGGARSGKSSFALKKAEELGKKRLYIATAQPIDEEMMQRIELHKRGRGRGWETREEPIDIAKAIKDGAKRHDVMVIDCLTLWLSNLIEEGDGTGGELLKKRLDDLINASKGSNAHVIIVSNEIGLGIVPENRLARGFRDLEGMVNQRVAQAASEVYFVVSGIPMRLK